MHPLEPLRNTHMFKVRQSMAVHGQHTGKRLTPILHHNSASLVYYKRLHTGPKLLIISMFIVHED